MALALSRRSLGQVAPNPAVGAVIVRDGRVLGRGATGAGGSPHAEVVALSQAVSRFGADALSGATMHVTLEPCAHHGRTPPCADALIDAGIARVVAPIEDPDPRVSGQGFQRLLAAGLEVITGRYADMARQVNAGFLSRIQNGRPHVTLKLATTLDGRIATATGQSRWITGLQARRVVHLMRTRSDAVMIGAGTARIDDPMLDVRGFGDRAHQPIRIVVDGSLSLPLTSRLARTIRDAPLWLLHRRNAPHERREAFQGLGARLFDVRTIENGRLSIGDALLQLADVGVTRLLCEGGGQISTALIAEDVVDELVLFQAGRTFGGDGAAAVAGFGLKDLADAPKFDLVTTNRLGDDIMSVWRRNAAR